MNQEAKIEVYQESYSKLKENKHVYNLQYPTHKKHLEYNFCIGTAKVDVTIFSGSEMMKIQATIVYDDKSEDDIFNLSNELVEGHAGLCTNTYDNKIVFSQNAIVTGMDNISSKKIMHNTIDSFVDFIISKYGQDERIFETASLTSNNSEADNSSSNEELEEKSEITKNNSENSAEEVQDSINSEDYESEVKETELSFTEENNVVLEKEEDKTETANNKEEDASKEENNIAGFEMPKRTSKVIDRPTFSPISKKEEETGSAILTQADENTSEILTSVFENNENDIRLIKQLNDIDPEKDEQELVQYSERMKRMYEDLNRVTLWRQEQLECREHLCKEVEAALNKEKAAFAEFRTAKELEYNDLITKAENDYKAKKEENDKRELELNLKAKEIEIEYQNMEMKRQTIADMESVFDKRKSELLAKQEELNKNVSNVEYTAAANEEYSIKVSEMEKYIAELEDNMRKYEDDLTTFDNSLMEINKLFKESKLEWEQKEAEYNAVINNSNKTIEDNKISKEKLEQLSELLKKAEEEKDSLKRDNEELCVELHSKKARIEELQEVIDNTSNTTSLIVRDANKIKELLAEKDIEVDFTPGAGELMLSGSKGALNIAINTELKIIYLEKIVKKANKYIINVSKLNQQDIRSTFYLEKDKICCKYVYKNIEDEIIDLVNKYEVFV